VEVVAAVVPALVVAPSLTGVNVVARGTQALPLAPLLTLARRPMLIIPSACELLSMALRYAVKIVEEEGIQKRKLG
jgi:hypothetical protein